MRHDDHALTGTRPRSLIARRSWPLAAAICISLCNLHFAVGHEPSLSESRQPASNSIEPDENDVPLYDGRTLQEWRDRIGDLDFDDPLVEEDVPGLLAIVEDVDAPWFSRRQAAVTLGRIGAPARDAVPVLIGLLDEPGDDSDTSTQLWALKALARFGPVAEEAAPVVADLLEDPARSDLPRLAAIETLGRIGPQQPEVLPALIRVITETLQSGSLRMHTPQLDRAIAAAEMMELFGGNAAAAVPVLIRAARSDSLLLKRSAANTLGMVGSAADPAIPTLVDLLLFDESAEVRDLAARALGRIGPAADGPLTQLLVDPDASVRLRAARAFAELSAISPKAEAALREAAESDEPRVAVAALNSLWLTTGDADAVIPGALDLLSHPDREVRMRAVELLESLGPAADAARPRLRELAEDERPHARQAADRVLRTTSADRP